ncbi:MAG: AAA family ATPase [Candidatus Bathyarchaeia archaeon]|jgi:adenylate kinase
MRAPSASERRAIIVTGTPGTGKTTFSKKLAKEIDADHIPLTQFVSEYKLYTGFDRERKSRIVNLARVQVSLNRLLSRTRRPIIVDTHIPEGIIPKNLVKLVFVLRCHPRILETRLSRKKWKPSKVRENVLAEMLDSCLTDAVKWYGWPRVIQLDTSHASVTKCAATAKRILRHRARRKVKIDWITTLDKEHSLARYLEW